MCHNKSIRRRGIENKEGFIEKFKNVSVKTRKVSLKIGVGPFAGMVSVVLFKLFEKLKF